MAYLAVGRNLIEVSRYLKRNLPSSATVYQVVQRILEGHDPGYNVWSSHDFGSSFYNVIVVSADPEKCKNANYRQTVHLFCNNPRDIEKTVSSPGVINTAEKLCFYGITEQHVNYIKALNILEKFKITKTLEVHRLWCFNIEQVPDCSLSDDLRLSEITKDVTPLIASKVQGIDDDGSIDVLQDTINWRLPSICVWNKDGQPIAWIRKSFWGDQGTLFVAQQYRRKGIAKYITSRLAKQLIDMEGSVHCDIEVGNDASIGLVDALGFQQIDNQKYIWLWFSLE